MDQSIPISIFFIPLVHFSIYRKNELHHQTYYLTTTLYEQYQKHKILFYFRHNLKETDIV